jgi:hypothetical protein
MRKESVKVNDERWSCCRTGCSRSAFLPTRRRCCISLTHSGLPGMVEAAVHCKGLEYFSLIRSYTDCRYFSGAVAPCFSECPRMKLVVSPPRRTLSKYGTSWCARPGTGGRESSPHCHPEPVPQDKVREGSLIAGEMLRIVYPEGRRAQHDKLGEDFCCDGLGPQASNRHLGSKRRSFLR